MKRKMLSMKSSTSWPWSRKYSATVRPVRPTRGARAGRLVHLAENQRALRLHVRVGIARVGVDLRFDQLVVEVVAFARALADAGEHRIAAVRLGDVVDQLLDQHRLADAGAAEEADLAALGVGREQVDDLDAGDQDLRFRRLLDVGRRRLVDGAKAFRRDRACFVDRLADHVHDAPERAHADRHRDRSAGVLHLLAAHEAFRDVHGDAAHRVLAELLGDLENEAMAVVVGLEGVEDGRQVAVELHVDDRADHLGDTPDGIRLMGHCLVLVSSSLSCRAGATVSVRAPRRPK